MEVMICPADQGSCGERLQGARSFPLGPPLQRGVIPRKSAATSPGSSQGVDESMGYKVAVIGATGNVGREMLNILAEREFPADEVFAIASRRSMGVEVSFGDKRLKCRDLEQFDFRGVDFALMSAGSAVSKEWAPKIGAQGCVVIDNSSCWRIRPRRAADRARGQRRRGGRLHQEEHHRQSELLDRPARRGAEAAARPRQDQARGGRDLSIGVRRRQGGDGRAVGPDQGHLRHPADRAQEIHQADRLQRHSSYRRLHGGRLDQGGVEDDGRDQEDPRSQDQAHRDLRARAGVRRPFRGRQCRVREADHGGARRARSCARRRACSWSTSASPAAT